MTSRNANERGFALVEAMVALAIIAVMSTLFFQTLSGTARAARGIETRRLAVLVAQSQLAAAEGGALRRGDEGDNAGLHWSVAIEPWGQGARSSSLALERVRVMVSASATARPVVSLESLRVAQ